MKFAFISEQISQYNTKYFDFETLRQLDFDIFLLHSLIVEKKTQPRH